MVYFFRKDNVSNVLNVQTYRSYIVTYHTIARIVTFYTSFLTKKSKHHSLTIYAKENHKNE